MSDPSFTLLVVDDNEMNREVLSRRLRREGYDSEMATDGREALDMIQADPSRYDLVLLDIMMPNINGYQVLETLKGDDVLRHIPVIMISAVDDLDSIVRCIEMGAEDYLPKPFNPTLLRARIGASLEKKRLRDQEQAYLAQIQAEQERSERLLLNILPKAIAERLKINQGTIADSFNEATVLFADIVDFTELSSQIPAVELINLLNEIFSTFDHLAEQHGLEKIKTIGDAYMVVGGLPIPRDDHAEAIANMALDMLDTISGFQTNDGRQFSMRIGVHTGPVVAGVIGARKFIYDLWGDTVNLASRMESHGIPGCIQVSPATYERLTGSYTFDERGIVEIKGKGEMVTFLLTGKA